MTDQTSRDLLRAIDDAQARLRHYRIIFGLLLTGVLGSLALACAGAAIGIISAHNKIDMGTPAAALLFVGIPGLFLFVPAIIWWWELHHMETRPWVEGVGGGGREYAGPASRVVTQAKRAHEDHVMAGAA